MGLRGTHLYAPVKSERARYILVAPMTRMIISGVKKICEEEGVCGLQLYGCRTNVLHSSPLDHLISAGPSDRTVVSLTVQVQPEEHDCRDLCDDSESQPNEALDTSPN